MNGLPVGSIFNFSKGLIVENEPVVDNSRKSEETNENYEEALIEAGRRIKNEEFQAAALIYEDLVEKNVTVALYGLALLLYNGEGICKDFSRADNYMQRAAEQGNTEAINFLNQSAQQKSGNAEKMIRLSFFSPRSGETIAVKGSLMFGEAQPSLNARRISNTKYFSSHDDDSSEEEAARQAAGYKCQHQAEKFTQKYKRNTSQTKDGSNNLGILASKLENLSLTTPTPRNSIKNTITQTSTPEENFCANDDDSSNEDTSSKIDSQYDFSTKLSAFMTRLKIDTNYKDSRFLLAHLSTYHTHIHKCTRYNYIIN
ncbi:MAG: hypothetical protein K0R08_1467 [Solimicrobium sp.]|nr:hypothetical protein [Solimicrobium sp.]